MQFPFELGTWLVLVPVALALGILALTGNRANRGRGLDRGQRTAAGPGGA